MDSDVADVLAPEPTVAADAVAVLHEHPAVVLELRNYSVAGRLFATAASETGDDIVTVQAVRCKTPGPPALEFNRIGLDEDALETEIGVHRAPVLFHHIESSPFPADESNRAAVLPFCTSLGTTGDAASP